MSAVNDKHGRARSILRAQRLLTLREGVSPLNLVVDNLEQRAHPIIAAYVARAKANKDKIAVISFSSLKKPAYADGFVKAAGRSLALARKDLVGFYESSKKENPRQGVKVIIDSLNTLISSEPDSLTSFLSSIIAPGVSVIAIYHSDMPVVLPRDFNEYAPHPFALASHLATAILTLSNLQQEIERQGARNRALVEPEWGLAEGREGVLVGLRGKGKALDRRSVVVDVEERTKSGKTIVDRFYVLPAGASGGGGGGGAGMPKIMMLAEHPAFAPHAAGPEGGAGAGGGGGGGESNIEDMPASTFDLNLTEKQRKDREGIVLPYFDAQTDIGAGEGGRILYEMGREDDFDDEEDEI